jgi:hypothetical protein
LNVAAGMTGSGMLCAGRRRAHGNINPASRRMLAFGQVASAAGRWFIGLINLD